MARPHRRLKIRVDYDVPIKMRDGVATYADVYLPEGDGRHPTLLSRTPYDKSGANGYPSPWNGVRNGYAVVMQDVRGRYKSEGEFRPFLQEIDDGYDSVEWCAAQPWSTGRVGMHGGSYVGSTQWLAAIADPPHLTAIAPYLSPSNHYEEWIYRGGALQHQFALHWIMAHLSPPGRGPWPEGGKQDNSDPDLEAVYDEMYRFLPTKDAPLPWGRHILREWLSHPSMDEYWERVNVGSSYSRIRVPALIIAGWYDFFLQGSLNNFIGMRSKGGTKQGAMSNLIVGPWNHNVPSEFSYGEKADWAGLGMEGLILRWFDRWLKGDETAATAPSVRIFVMGDEVWRNEQEWPLARANPVRFYLHSGGGANGSGGDGALSRSLPSGQERSDRFVYDPLKPVPTAGQDMVARSRWPAEGPHDQSAIERRTDVLVYSTPPLEREIEVTGRVILTLFAATTAVDTDFTARLVDVRTTGFSQLLAEGIVRARYRETTKKVSPLTPGLPYEYTIDLWSTSNVFKEGHSIRVDISSSSFPKFDRNLNTGRPVAEESEAVLAIQTILHDPEHPSHLVLPVVPRG